MTDFTPEQECAIETIESNISVSAGAGSGKTRVLVERFVNIIAKEKQLRMGYWQSPLRVRPQRKCVKESEQN